MSDTMNMFPTTDTFATSSAGGGTQVTSSTTLGQSLPLCAAPALTPSTTTASTTASSLSGGLTSPPLSSVYDEPLASVYDETQPPSDLQGDDPTVGQVLSMAPFNAVSTACLGCRGKHLKCDGQNPCSRCQQAEIKCIYIASRRGYKGPRRKRLRSSSSSPPPQLSQSSASGLLAAAAAAAGPLAPPDSCPMMLGAPRIVTSSSPGAPPTLPMAVSTSSYAAPVVVSNGTPSISSAASIHSMSPDPYASAAVLSGAGPVVTSAPVPVSIPPSVALSHLNLYRNQFSSDPSGLGFGVSGAMAMAVVPPIMPSLEDRCIDAFYHFFYGGHPFVLPKDILLSMAKEVGTVSGAGIGAGTTASLGGIGMGGGSVATSPNAGATSPGSAVGGSSGSNSGSANIGPGSNSSIFALLAAMRYIGSLYIDAGPARARLFDEAMRLVHLTTTPKDGFLIQALVMLIIGQDGSCEQEQARQLLGECERIAVEIGLNHRGFAVAHGRGNPQLEESWRRTWWDLFVVDGMVAGVHRMTNFLLFDIPADVGLPCEEQQYLSGMIPPTSYIEDFDDRLFTGEDREFSSFTYRIASARILGRFMRCPPILHAQDENLEKIESLLSNWRMHLPPSKQDDLTRNGQLDEMMFQAHFIIHACSILLHQPHSQLDSSPARSVTSCAPHSHVPSGDMFNAHTRHTVTAACEISKMVTQAVPLLSHTHFFTCVITLSSIVHLSKWALYFIQDEEDLRQQIRLNIGALSKLSEVWRAANTAGGQVTGVAQEIYRAKKAQQINPAFWVGFTQEEMISSINADEGIMSEFESMLAVTTQ